MPIVPSLIKPTAGYVSANYDREHGFVYVWERDDNGVRSRRTIEVKPYFYYDDPEEKNRSEYKFTTIFGNKVKRIDCESEKQQRSIVKSFEAENEIRKSRGLSKDRLTKLFESDLSPLDRALMDVYYGAPVPNMNVAFIDIETDYDPEKPFSRPTFIHSEDPRILVPDPEVMYAPINAVTIYKQWRNEYLTIAVPPKGYDGEIPKEISLKELGSDIVSRFIPAVNEVELLKLFFKEIEHVDVLSGWNSEFFDLPYLVMRTDILEKSGERVSMRNWLLPGGDFPVYRNTETEFGDKKPVINLSRTGRNHVDYLNLFKKFTFEGRASFKLASIAEDELDIPKLEYEGSLADLYNNNFMYFLKYNVRDVEIIHRIDEKFKLMRLANLMSHENTVLIETVLGTVRYVETGITNYAHNILKKVVGNKNPSETEKVEGAIVLTPKIGLHHWLGSVDITSLYPSVIRSLNISPEKIIGQFVRGEFAWNGIINNSNELYELRLETGEVLALTGKDWKQMFKEQKWAISAFGTVFDQSSGQGLIPQVLSEWFFGRKSLQKEKKKWTAEVKRLKKENKTQTPEYIDACKNEEYYDLLQLTRKIQLNSTYGALLNAFFRFFRMEMGASVTASGRAITTHMVETISSILDNNLDDPENNKLIKRFIPEKYKGNGKEFVKAQNFYSSPEAWNTFLSLPKRHLPESSAAYCIKSKSIIYGDTDSCYYICVGATNKEEAIEIADLVADEVNASFPSFMVRAFNCQTDGFHDLIKAGREIVGIRGLFQAKKKYMIKVVDKEGNEVDELKSMGSEIKKSDTPRTIQNFLKETVDMILDGREFTDVEVYVNESRKNLFSKSVYHDIINLGVSKAVNNFDKQYEDYQKTEKIGKGRVKLPGHIRAAVNFNETALHYEGKGATLIQSGDKVKVYYLIDNHQKLKSIAIPSDSSRFPHWFNEHFKVDVKLTEQKMIDAKLEGIFSAWGYEVPTFQGAFVRKIVQF